MTFIVFYKFINSINCKIFTLLGSVSYVSQTIATSETKTLNDNISNYKKVLIGLFDGIKIINPIILTVSEFENIGMDINIPINQVQGVVTYISYTSCKFASYNPTSSRIDIVLYGIK